MNRPPSHRPPIHRRRIFWTVALVLAALSSLGLFSVIPVLHAQDAAATSTPSASGYEYTVQAGDSWSSVARRTGVSVRELQAANPRSVRSTGWLRTGETLLIPGAAPAQEDAAPAPSAAAPAAEQFHTVGAGESWNSIAALYGIPARLLRAANPRAVRDDLVLFRGERLLIPPVQGSAQESGSGSAAQGVEFTPTPTRTPASTPTPRLTPVPSDTPTPTSTVPGLGVSGPEETSVPTETPTETATATEVAPPTATPETAIGINCPNSFANYPAQINSILNTVDFGIEGLRSYLDDCGSAVEDGLIVQDLNGDGADELLVLYADPNVPEAAPAGDMIVFAFGDTGFTESFRARAGGRVAILELADVNLDGRGDIVWSDTTCGANTCFDTIQVRSWDGAKWANWTVQPITMAYAETTLDDVSEVGQGAEIVLAGGVYGSAGAGPQRSRTESWASVDGRPYSLIERAWDESECIYFAVLDANESFLRLPDADLDELEQLYTKAATDPSLTTCWTRPDEEAELRSFALFRLSLVAAYQGVPEISGDLIDSISEIYTSSIYSKVGDVWLDTFAATQSIPQACQAANAFAAENPEAWEVLADYGYANPTFGANDVCPVLDVEDAGAALGTDPQPPTAPLPPDESGEEPAEPEPGATAEPSPAEPTPSEPDNEEPASATVPDCPASLADYASTLPTLLKAVQGEITGVQEWLIECRAMTDSRGALAKGDLNGDGQSDFLILPVIVSDLGFGPNGTQGAVLLYNGNGDNEWQLAASPEIYGQSNLLAVQDLNEDGAIDAAWTVVGCSTFCVTEVQVVTWDTESEEYLSLIQPGATLAEGTAEFVDPPADAPGLGKQLKLVGGVSNTPEGGLSVPHTELWQSVDGGPFQRISWLYDRSVEGNDCLGLRLIEADVALHASSVLGYDDAIAAYEAAFAPELKACSIFGVDGTEELVGLQGLASFRLVQAQVLEQRMDDARASLESLTLGQPEGAYTKAATDWLAEWEVSFDAQAACDAVQPVFDANEQMWQITDHFGYNHPALAAEQLCFVPTE